MPKKRKKRKIKSNKKIHAKQEPQAVNFLAPEFVYYKKGIAWYMIFSLIGLSLIAIAIWQKQWLLALIIFLACVVFFQYSQKRPQSKNCHIGQDKIKIDDKEFSVDWFKSFSIVYDEPISHLFLETVKRFNPPFWLNIKNKDLKRVIKVLREILPEKPASQVMITKINRWIRF